MFPFLFNKAHLPSLHAQLVDLLQEALDKMTSQHMIDEDYLGQPVLEFNLRVNQPRLPHQTNFNDKHFDSFTSKNKRMIHLESCETAGPFLRALFRYIKDLGQMRKIFGRYVHIIEPLMVNASGQDCTLLCRMAQLHTNFHNSVQLHSTTGIVNLTASAQIGIHKDSVDSSSLFRQSLRDNLYCITLQDSLPLFLSILPRPNGMTVDCVIPNTATAETQLVQMNHHLPGYLKFFLQELGYNLDGINDLLNRACNPDLTMTISQLAWDAKHKVVVLPSEAELESNLDEMEKEPWMQHAHPAAYGPTAKKCYNNPDRAFPLTSDLSVTTIHANKVQPSSPTISANDTASSSSSPTKEVVIVEPSGLDDVSTLS